MKVSTDRALYQTIVAAGDGITTVGAPPRFAGAAKAKGSRLKMIRRKFMMRRV